MLEISDEANRPTEFNEIFGPSLKMMHQCVTKFADQVNGYLDEIDRSQNAQLALKALAAVKISQDRDETVETQTTDDGDGDLSDSYYEVITKSQHTFIKHNGYNYRKSNPKISTPFGKAFGFPEGKYRCIGEKFKCTGTMEPIQKRNGKVNIRSIDPHTCK